MSITWKLFLSGVASVAALLALDAIDDATGLDAFSLVTPAEARVGRPLTPVSVAGVARRTTRRCAAGIYYC